MRNLITARRIKKPRHSRRCTSFLFLLFLYLADSDLASTLAAAKVKLLD